MKKQFALALLCAIIITLASCKKESAEEVEITPPVEAKDIPAAATKFVVDTVASSIAWGGSKPTGKHTGTIHLLKGELFIKDSLLESGKFTIDMKSITVTDLKDAKQKQDLENHLKGLKADAADHFFNTTKYPTGLFEITAITKAEGKDMVEGNLTLKDISKNIKFPAVITITDSTVAIESESFKIDRTLWNINFSSKSAFENLGNNYIDDDIELKVTVNAKRP